MPRKKKSAVKNTTKKGLYKKKPKTKLVKKTGKKPQKNAKKKKVSAIPKGYSSITAYLFVKNGADAMDFYKKAFGAKEVMRMEFDGKIGHAELQIGDTKFMLADECAEKNATSPHTLGGSAVGMHLYVKNVDAVIERAIEEGAKLTRAIEDMFYGDRSGGIQDPFGHQWFVSTHIEDVTPAKVRKRMAEMKI